jgi:uncharacterized membrane protein
MISREHRIALSLLLLASFGVGLAAWPFLPAQAPIHWDMHDHPNGYAPRAVAAFLFPGINLITLGLMLALPRLRPIGRRFAKMRNVYGVVWVSVATAMLCIKTLCMVVDAGVPLPIGKVILVVIGLLCAILGNFMSKVRRNYFFGIRTPWPLANDLVWERTHRIGAVLFFAFGILTALISLLAPPSVAAPMFLVGIVLFTAWACIYSAWLFHHFGSVKQPIS